MALTTALKRQYGDYLGFQDQLQRWRRAPGEKLGALATDNIALGRSGTTVPSEEGPVAAVGWI